ncbi:MAG: nicotinate-nicotinamide nucleotide adenylyltransferase [Gaiellaceae bacterium]
MIGLLGGRFDPPHKGHVALARAALEQLPIDRLVFLVAEHPGHCDAVASAEDRMRMAEAAFEGLGEVVLDPHSFTVDTVRGGRFGDAFFIVGADQAAAFDTWKEPDEILRWVKLAIGTRSGHEGATTFELDSPPISGSDVRERVARGEPIDDLVPAAVARIIEERGLYR